MDIGDRVFVRVNPESNWGEEWAPAVVTSVDSSSEDPELVSVTVSCVSHDEKWPVAVVATKVVNSALYPREVYADIPTSEGE